jgi:hypothetical protein
MFAVNYTKEYQYHLINDYLMVVVVVEVISLDLMMGDYDDYGKH